MNDPKLVDQLIENDTRKTVNHVYLFEISSPYIEKYFLKIQKTI